MSIQKNRVVTFKRLMLLTH